LKAGTILVVDDDPSMLDFLTQRLSPEGFAVSTASSGQEGINQAIALPPDLILLDLRMPVPDGVAVCKALRANQKTQRIPILVVTGVLSPPQLEEAMTSGADDFVSKPIDMTDLLVRIRAMLACRTITDPIERLTRYIETVRASTTKSLRPHPPTDKK
jgi:DNA-binding response OmpR family regulator